LTVFLSAEWRDLVMLNYEVDGKLLADYVPPGTVLDSFNGRTYISLVGFRFRHTKLFGSLRIPYHADFDEVNLRFYVRRKRDNEERRGVVFIAEIVPKWAVAHVARMAYGENYFCFPMKHRVSSDGPNRTAEYAWLSNDAWCRFHAHTSVAPTHPQDGSLEQFITEHYWGYSTKRNGHSLEYRVSHTPWNVWTSTAAGFEGDATGLYGFELGKVLRRPPDSAFIADGSPVVVFAGNKIR
jgi:uncharacterized protein YqjF (DUF2071 family)